jgi:di/tricarboxylate transporter
MTGQQITIFTIIALMLVMFTWNRLRYDLVAILGLLATALAGLIEPEEVFAGLGHPAVITVAAVLVVSRGLFNAGVVDTIARYLTRVGTKPLVQVATLTSLVALCSGFMNNVGSLALFMPVAVWMSRRSRRSPSFLLMPLAFGSLLGGMLTLIGTPPNIIIAAYRIQAGGESFGIFDFMPVGAAIAAAGVLFISLVGWRLTPRRQKQDDSEELFEISAYLTELHVPENCKFAGRTLYDLITEVKEDAEVVVIGLIRDGKREEVPSTYKVLQVNDILQVEADSDNLKTLMDITGLELAAETEGQADREKDADKNSRKDHSELTLAEVVVTPGSILVGKTASRLDIRRRHDVNLLAVARQGRRLRERLKDISFNAGDILLIQTREDSFQSALEQLGCLPLASRGLRVARPRKVLVATLVFAASLLLIAFEILPASISLVIAAITMLLLGLIGRDETYESIDMPVIVLLAAMIPIGRAMENTGGSQLIADYLLSAGNSAPPAVTIAVLMVTVMLLSNVINNAAAALLASPVAVNIAEGMGASADPFLMAVAVGASCAFLTPIGHQSNTMVMEPGGYRFGDYWKMGLPLSILVVAVGVPLILMVWPLHN